MSEHSLSVLKDVMAKAGVASVVISSTARDPFNQARVMFDNIKKTGVAAQKKLYAAAGDAVIDVFAAAQKAGKTRAETIKLMEAKIIALGPEKVSHHAADLTKLNVFDVAPSSIPSAKKKRLGGRHQGEQGDRQVHLPAARSRISLRDQAAEELIRRKRYIACTSITPGTALMAPAICGETL